MYVLHQVAGVEQIGLARAGRCAAHIDPGGGPLRAQHHAAAGGAIGVGEVAHVQAQHLGKVAVVGQKVVCHNINKNSCYRLQDKRKQLFL